MSRKVKSGKETYLGYLITGTISIINSTQHSHTTLDICFKLLAYSCSLSSFLSHLGIDLNVINYKLNAVWEQIISTVGEGSLAIDA